MKKLSKLVFAVAALSAASVSWAEEVVRDSKPFLVKYTDGIAEKYVAEWIGIVSWDKSESGGPAVPLKGKFIDDRKCHWTITAVVTRRLYLMNRNGDRFKKDDFDAVFNAKHVGQGSDFVLTQLRPENCGDAEARFQSDVNDARKALRDQFAGITASDVNAVKEKVKGWPGFKAVE